MKLIIRKPDKHINDELLEILITELVKTTCQYFTCIDQIENSKIDYDYIENYIISTLHTHFVSYLKEKINDIDNYGLSKEFITETITVFENFN